MTERIKILTVVGANPQFIEATLVWPLHPRLKNRLADYYGPKGIRLIEPLPYGDGQSGRKIAQILAAH